MRRNTSVIQDDGHCGAGERRTRRIATTPAPLRPERRLGRGVPEGDPTHWHSRSGVRADRMACSGMRTALDAPHDALDAQEQSFIANMREHGWFDTAVLGDDEGPSFSYSSGFWVNTGSPEIIMFGMKREIIHNVFWDIYRDVTAGRCLPDGGRTDQVFANLPACIFPVAKRYYRDYLGWNRWFYGGDDFPCLHIVWPDRAGIFPWESSFDEEFRDDQPDLTEHGWLAALA